SDADVRGGGVTNPTQASAQATIKMASTFASITSAAASIAQLANANAATNGPSILAALNALLVHISNVSNAYTALAKGFPPELVAGIQGGRIPTTLTMANGAYANIAA